MTSPSYLELLKLQLNLNHDLDDALLNHKLAAAQAWIKSHIGSAFGVTDAASVEAMLQLAAYWYEQRESASDVTMRPVPFGVYDLLASHREQVTGYIQPAPVSDTVPDDA